MRASDKGGTIDPMSIAFENTTVIDNTVINDFDIDFMNDIPTCTPTKKEVYSFTQGDCWAFALEVRKQFGYPIIVHIFAEEEPLECNKAMAGWLHAYNVLPDGNGFDVTGVYPLDEMEEFWGSFDICKDVWNGLYMPKDIAEEHALFDRRERRYPKVNVEKAVRKAHAVYVG